MPLPGHYIINRTDPANGSFIIEPLEKNGPVSPVDPTLDPSATSASSTLLLVGKGTPNYGERLQENMLNVMENFSNPSPPVYPVRGQVWHDSNTGLLMLFDGADWLPANIPFKVLVVGTTVTSGMLVNIYPEFEGPVATPKIRPADASLGRQADGFVNVGGVSGEFLVVFLQGTVGGYAFLNPGEDYWLGNAGGVTNSPSQSENFVIQVVGKAVSPTEILFTPGNVIIG